MIGNIIFALILIAAFIWAFKYIYSIFKPQKKLKEGEKCASGGCSGCGLSSSCGDIDKD